MRKYMMQGRPSGTPAQQIDWLFRQLSMVSQASIDNDTIDIASNFVLNNTYTTQRTIPASPSQTDFNNVLCTLIADLQKGGSNRTG
jgi:hypothetical protein